MTRSFLDRFYSFIAYIQGCIQEFVQGGGLCTRWDFTGPGASLAPIAPAPLPLSSIRVKILRNIRKTNV